jgi:putative hemolysin
LIPFLIFIVLIICSGLISSSEVAYFSLGIKDIKDLEEQNSPSSKRALLLKEKPRYLLATILIANNFVNVAIVIVADIIGKDIFWTITLWR